MAKAQWYLLAYDITHTKRLQKMGKLMQKKGIPLQKSVYCLLATPQQIDALLQHIETIIHLKHDDVRIYPIDDISAIWLYGSDTTPDLAKPHPNPTPWQKMKLWIHKKWQTRSKFPTQLKGE